MTSKRKRKKKNEGTKRTMKRVNDVTKKEKMNEKSSLQVEVDAGENESDSRGATKKVATSSKSEEAKADSQENAANKYSSGIGVWAQQESGTNKYSSGIGVSAKQESRTYKCSSGIGVSVQQENAANKYSSGIGVWAHQEDKAKKYSSGIGVLAEENECRIEKRQNVKSVEKFEQRGVSECGIGALHSSGSGESCEGF